MALQPGQEAIPGPDDKEPTNQHGTGNRHENDTNMPTKDVPHSGNMPWGAGGERPADPSHPGLEGVDKDDEDKVQEVVGTLPNDPSNLPEAQKALDEHTQAQAKRRRQNLIGGGVAAGLLAATLGAGGYLASRLGNDKEAAPTPKPVATSTPNPSVSQTPSVSETSSVSPTSVPTTSETATAEAPSHTAEKGSVEYYQVYTSDAPTPVDAIKKFGDLYTEFVMGGTPGEESSDAATKARENILTAFFGPDLSTHGETIDGWLKRREVLTNDKTLIPGMSGGQDLQFAETFNPVNADPVVDGDTYTLEVLTSQTTNAIQFFANQASLMQSEDLDITLTKVTNSSGQEVWQVVKMPFHQG